tara:strand:+ start:152 stop:298 length:147 start_codon:yes stop_codon:yes gene_type:complete
MKSITTPGSTLEETILLMLKSGKREIHVVIMMPFSETELLAMLEMLTL